LPLLIYALVIALTVIPAKAGIQAGLRWIPAFPGPSSRRAKTGAGMTFLLCSSLAIFLISLLLNGSLSTLALASAKDKAQIHGVFVGMGESEFSKFYPREKLRTYRRDGPDEWSTFNEPLQGPSNGVVTFYFQNGKVKQWKFNDRPEVIEEYLGEFCSLQGFPTIFTAIKNVLQGMPYQDFLNATNRQRPVIFTEFYDSGTARFASSQEFFISEDDPPCCQKGFTIIKLGLGLGLAQTPEPIEGLIAHELAHRVLDHIRKEHMNCDAEREANALIKKWGFKKEFQEASKLFGQRKGDPAACQETPHKER